MLDVLAANPVLTVFLVIAFGSLFGLIPFGPIRFGPAGALFVGLALSVLDPRLGVGLELVRTIGLALFVYTVGLAAGPTLIRTFRRQAPMMIGSAVVLRPRPRICPPSRRRANEPPCPRDSTQGLTQGIARPRERRNRARDTDTEPAQS